MSSFPIYTGKNPTDEYLEAMMNEAPGPINFTMFLTMFGEKLNGTDPEDVIRNAFACFDEEGTGKISNNLTSLLFSFLFVVDDLSHFEFCPVLSHPLALSILSADCDRIIASKWEFFK